MTPEQADIVAHLRERAEAMTTMLSEPQWKPSRSHVEALRNYMAEGADEIDRLQSLWGVRRPEDVARIILKEMFGEEEWSEVNERIFARCHEIAAAVLALPHTGQPQEGERVSGEDFDKNLQPEADASMLICVVDAAIEAIEQGSTSAPILECLKAGRSQFLHARSLLSAAPASPRAEGECAKLRAALLPCIGWLEYAYRNVDSATATAVKAHLPTMRALVAEERETP